MSSEKNVRSKGLFAIFLSSVFYAYVAHVFLWMFLLEFIYEKNFKELFDQTIWFAFLGSIFYIPACLAISFAMIFFIKTGVISTKNEAIFSTLLTLIMVVSIIMYFHLKCFTSYGDRNCWF